MYYCAWLNDGLPKFMLLHVKIQNCCFGFITSCKLDNANYSVKLK